MGNTGISIASLREHYPASFSWWPQVICRPLCWFLGVAAMWIDLIDTTMHTEGQGEDGGSRVLAAMWLPSWQRAAAKIGATPKLQHVGWLWRILILANSQNTGHSCHVAGNSLTLAGAPDLTYGRQCWSNLFEPIIGTLFGDGTYLGLTCHLVPFRASYTM
jgi:hypothetical protein